MIQSLSSDILEYIFSWLTSEELVQVSLVSKHWKYVSEHDYLWSGRVTEIIVPGTLKRNYVFQRLFSLDSFTIQINENDSNGRKKMIIPTFIDLCKRTDIMVGKGAPCTFILDNTIFCKNLENKSIYSMTWIKSLDLRGLGLDRIPKQVATMTWLESLDVTGNQLDNIDSLVNLVNLTRLNCSKNFIQKISESLFTNLTKLRFINIGHNCVNSIPSQIQYLVNLEYCTMDNNIIRFIPLEIKFLSKLTKLYLKNNFIESIPIEICELKNLSILNLENNNVHYIDSRVIKSMVKMPKLTAVYLSEDRLYKGMIEKIQGCDILHTFKLVRE